MSEPEVLTCFWHHVEETYTHGVDYKACGECWHVWPTEADFRADVAELALEMNTSSWRHADEPDWTVPDDLSTINACPLCSHDF